MPAFFSLFSLSCLQEKMDVSWTRRGRSAGSVNGTTVRCAKHFPMKLGESAVFNTLFIKPWALRAIPGSPLGPGGPMSPESPFSPEKGKQGQNHQGGRGPVTRLTTAFPPCVTCQDPPRPSLCGERGQSCSVSHGSFRLSGWDTGHGPITRFQRPPGGLSLNRL